MKVEMDDETFAALKMILDDHTSEDPAGSGRDEWISLSQLNHAHEIVKEWCDRSWPTSR
jgi:hypothetical protein